MKPRFSVIIPALNEEKFLPKLLESLSLQTQKDFEVIVVDGRSTDKTVAVAKTFEDKIPSLHVIVSPKASLPFQRNLGASGASGEWLVFIDADSVLLPYFFDRISWFIKEKQPKFFTTWFSPDSDIHGDALLTLFSNMFIEGSLLFHRPLSPGPLTIVDRSSFDLLGGYNESLSFGEDYDLTRRLVEAGVALHIFRETLCIFSLRRIRKEGKLRTFQIYAKATLLVLLTKKTPSHIHDYIMGGHLYDKMDKKRNKSTLKRLEDKLKTIFNKYP